MSLQRDTSTLGAVVGIAFAVAALVGSRFLGWEWGGSFTGQPVATVVGVIAAVFAVAIVLQRLRE